MRTRVFIQNATDLEDKSPIGEGMAIRKLDLITDAKKKDYLLDSKLGQFTLMMPMLIIFSVQLSSH